MTISYSDGFSSDAYWLVKTRRITFVDEKEFFVRLVEDVGLTVDYPPGWEFNPAWTPSQIASNTPMYGGYITLFITDLGDIPKWYSAYVNTNEKEYRIGRFYLMTGSSSLPYLLRQQDIRNDRLFLFDGAFVNFSYINNLYNCRYLKVSFSSVCSGSIAIILPISR